MTLYWNRNPIDPLPEQDRFEERLPAFLKLFVGSQLVATSLMRQFVVLRAIAPITVILRLARPRVTQPRGVVVWYTCDLSCVAGVELLCHSNGNERAASFGSVLGWVEYGWSAYSVRMCSFFPPVAGRRGSRPSRSPLACGGVSRHEV